MNKQQAIEVLTAHNEWRRDKGDTKNLTMHEPKVIGEAIDVAIAALSDETVSLPAHIKSIKIPTDTMDREFQTHYRHGYEAGKKAVTLPDG